MQALSPQIALQLITASESSEARNRGVRMVPGILTGKDGRAVMSFPALKMSRGVFLETLRAHLSAAEQVPESPPLSPANSIFPAADLHTCCILLKMETMEYIVGTY